MCVGLHPLLTLEVFFKGFEEEEEEEEEEELVYLLGFQGHHPKVLHDFKWPSTAKCYRSATLHPTKPKTKLHCPTRPNTTAPELKKGLCFHSLGSSPGLSWS